MLGRYYIEYGYTLKAIYSLLDIYRTNIRMYDNSDNRQDENKEKVKCLGKVSDGQLSFQFLNPENSAREEEIECECGGGGFLMMSFVFIHVSE